MNGLRSGEIGTAWTAVIFCGGRGTRLRRHVPGIPKALAPVGDRPYMNGMLHQLRANGVTQVILCVSPYTEAAISAYIREGKEFGLSVAYSSNSGHVENAGALWAALPVIRTPFVLAINGDTLVDLDFARFMRSFSRSGSAAALVTSSRMDQPHPGAIEVGAHGWVRAIHEAAQDRGLTWELGIHSLSTSNNGVYAVHLQRLLQIWPFALRIGKLEQGLLPHLAGRRQLWAFNNGARYLRDIGTPERFDQVQRDLSEINTFFGPDS